MSTTTVNGVQSTLGKLTFGRIVHSEWIKLRTLRSTFWTLASVVVVIVGFSVLVSSFMPDATSTAIPASFRDSIVVAAAASGISFGHLIIAVLGVIAISGEFSTGMIRSSFAAEPRRFPVLAAKAITVFITAFITGLVSLTISWTIATSALSTKGYDTSFFSSGTLWSILGGAASLGLIAIFAIGVGAIVKSTAAGIATALGILFVLPIIGNILVGTLPKEKWISDTMPYLINASSSGMATLPNGTLEVWQNVLSVVIWAAVAFIGGSILTQRRDA